MIDRAPGVEWFAAPISANGIDHGCLTVPASWDHPGAHEPFALPLVRYRARAGRASRAVIFLAGGPGESGLAAARYGPVATVIEELRRWADVITFDQRGTGGGRPALPPICSWQLSPAVPTRHEAALSRAQELGRHCAESWRDSGVDPNAFSIARSAADVSFLIDSLGYRGVSLFGISYGTQLGLSVLRTRTDLDAAALLNVEAPHQTVKMPRTTDRYLIRCLQALSAARIGEDVIHERLSSLIFGDARTVEVPGAGPVSLGSFEIQRGISRCLGSRTTMTRLANSLVRSPDDFMTIVGSSVSKWKSGPFDSVGLVVDSATGMSETRRARFEDECGHSLLGDAVDFPLPYVRSSLGIDDLGESARAPVSTQLPVLFVSGELDARTPPTNVTEIAGGFQRADHVVVPLGLHEPEFYLGDPAVLGRITGWLRERGN